LHDEESLKVLLHEQGPWKPPSNAIKANPTTNANANATNNGNYHYYHYYNGNGDKEKKHTAAKF